MITAEVRLTAMRLRELLYYDQTTGIFSWRVKRKSAFVGKAAGGANPKGHILISVDGRKYMAHRLAVLYMTDEWPKFQVDHRDCNKSNNSWSNLREATNGQNRANSKTSAASGYKGVYPNTRGWQAVIISKKRRIYLGTYTALAAAHAAYTEAALKYHGEFARP